MIYNMLVNYSSCFFTKLVSTLFIGNKFNKSFDIVYILSAIIFVFFLKYALQYVPSRFFTIALRQQWEKTKITDNFI